MSDLKKRTVFSLQQDADITTDLPARVDEAMWEQTLAPSKAFLPLESLVKQKRGSRYEGDGQPDSLSTTSLDYWKLSPHCNSDSKARTAEGTQ